MTARTITLPINPGSTAWAYFQWPSKAPGDDLFYYVDCAAWLADAGLTLVSVAQIEATSGLQFVGIPLITNGVIAVQITGGTPNTTASVQLGLSLSDNSYLVVNVALPIRADLGAGLSVIETALTSNQNAALIAAATAL